MIFAWTYGAINQDVQQFGLCGWNWSGAESAVVVPAVTFGRLEYTIPRHMLQFTLPNQLLQYTLPKTADFETGEP